MNQSDIAGQSNTHVVAHEPYIAEAYNENAIDFLAGREAESSARAWLSRHSSPRSPAKEKI